MASPSLAEHKASKTCSRHSRKAAVATCTRCASSVCRDCLVPTSVGIKCTTCTDQLGNRGPGGRPRWLVPAAAAAAVVLLAVLGVTSLTGGDESDRAGPSTLTAGVPQSRGVQFEGAGDVSISGTLSLPDRAAPEAGLAGVVILNGLGPTNRDGVAVQGAAPDTLYRDLSDALVKEGVVTLRYDKRGTGRSQLPPNVPLRFEDIVADAGAAVSFLAERAEVDPKRLAVIGHEEGGLAAMQLAASEPRIRGLALISVPGRPLLEVLADDRAGAPNGDVPGLRAVVGTLLATGSLPETIPPSLTGYFSRDLQAYLKDIFSIDPVALAARVEVPALFLRGEEATLVTAADEAALMAALPAGESFVVPQAGPSLAVAGQPTHSGGGMPADHEPVAAAPSSERSEEAMTRVVTFLTGATRG